MFIKKLGITLGCIISCSLVAAPNPASQEWVLKQLATVNTTLTAADWANVCHAGSSPASSEGCYGSSNTAAFAKLDNGLRGFSSLANFNTTLASPSSSVYIKAFLAGTNVPAYTNAIAVSVTGVMARCTLYVQKGTGINSDDGLNSAIYSSGASYRTGPQAPYIATINNQSSVNFYYNNSPNAGTASPPDPIYLICVGVNSTDGYTPVSIAGAITAN